MRITIMLASWVLCTAPAVHAQSNDARGRAMPQTRLEPPSINADELQTLNRLHASNLREIAASKLVPKRARNASVKRYGEVLLRHHTEADKELRALAAGSGVKLFEPKTDLGELQKTFNPANFDRTFLDHMARDHRAAIAQLKSDQATALNPELQALLNKALPVLQQHYEQCVQLLQSSPF